MAIDPILLIGESNIDHHLEADEKALRHSDEMTQFSFERATHSRAVKGRPFLSPRLLPGNTKGGSITVPLTSCLTGLD